MYNENLIVKSDHPFLSEKRKLPRPNFALKEVISRRNFLSIRLRQLKKAITFSRRYTDKADISSCLVIPWKVNKIPLIPFLCRFWPQYYLFRHMIFNVITITPLKNKIHWHKFTHFLVNMKINCVQNRTKVSF